MKNIVKSYEIKPFGTKIIFAYVKKIEDIPKIIRSNKELLKIWRSNFIGFEDSIFNGHKTLGFVLRTEDNKPVVIAFKHNHIDNNTLVHETNHLVHYLSLYFSFEKEAEFMAYLHEMLFKDFKQLIKK